MLLSKLFLAAAIGLATQAQAQIAASTAGTTVIVPAFGEVTHPNDQAIATFAVEEQDKDKAVASSRANQKMTEGTEIIRREDPQASLKTRGYYTYPVYPERRALPDGTVPKPLPIGWRVGQYLEVKTSNLAGLPKTTAAAQKILALNNLTFGLAPSTLKKLDERRVAATYQNLTERIASIAAAMGRRPAEATIDTVDFEGSGRFAQHQGFEVSVTGSRSLAKAPADVVEPSFEPGDTTLQMRLVGKVKFK